MKKIVLFFCLCLLSLCLCIGVGAEQAQVNGEEPQNGVVSTVEEENGAQTGGSISEEMTDGEEPRGIGEVLLGVWERYSGEIFSALTLLGSLAVAITYKRGLLPILYGALGSISDTAKRAGERAEGLAEAAEENILSLQGMTAPVVTGIEALGTSCQEMADKLRALEATLEGEAEDRALIKTAVAGVADMLWGVFTSANLPEYAKEQIGIRYNAIKGALEGVTNASREENTPV